MIDITITQKHLEKLYWDHGFCYTENAELLSEEMSELNKELMKLIRKRRRCAMADLENIPNIIDEAKPGITEEMAHVYICIEAIRDILGIKDSDIQHYIDAKEK